MIAFASKIHAKAVDEIEPSTMNSRVPYSEMKYLPEGDIPKGPPSSIDKYTWSDGRTDCETRWRSVSNNITTCTTHTVTTFPLASGRPPKSEIRTYTYKSTFVPTPNTTYLDSSGLSMVNKSQTLNPPNHDCGIKHSQVQGEMAKLQNQIAGLQREVAEGKKQLDNANRKTNEIEKRLKSEKSKQATAEINRQAGAVLDFFRLLLPPLIYTLMFSLIDWAGGNDTAIVFVLASMIWGSFKAIPPHKFQY